MNRGHTESDGGEETVHIVGLYDKGLFPSNSSEIIDQELEYLMERGVIICYQSIIRKQRSIVVDIKMAKRSIRFTELVDINTILRKVDGFRDSWVTSNDALEQPEIK